MEVISYLIILWIGLCIGSFLNVVIYRWSEGRSIRSPIFSFCPECKEILKWYHNIPLFSYVLLRGKCAYCKKLISPRYPFVEVVAGFLALWSFIKIKPLFGWMTYLYFFTFLCILISIFFIDLKTKEIPDKLSLTLIFLGFIGSLLGINPFLSIEQSLLSGLAGIGLLFLINEIYYHFSGRDGLGMGDFKLMGGIGAFLGYKGFYWILLLASLLGILFFFGMVLWSKKIREDQIKIDLKTEIPFGPLLSLGAILYFFYLIQNI